MRPCLAAILTIAVAAFFWISWYSELQDYVRDVNAIKGTLTGQGYTNIYVYPKSQNCYTWNAMENEHRHTTGKVCFEDKP